MRNVDSDFTQRRAHFSKTLLLVRLVETLRGIKREVIQFICVSHIVSPDCVGIAMALVFCEPPVQEITILVFQQKFFILKPIQN